MNNEIKAEDFGLPECEQHYYENLQSKYTIYMQNIPITWTVSTSTSYNSNSIYIDSNGSYYYIA